MKLSNVTKMAMAAAAVSDTDDVEEAVCEVLDRCEHEMPVCHRFYWRGAAMVALGVMGERADDLTSIQQMDLFLRSLEHAEHFP